MRQVIGPHHHHHHLRSHFGSSGHFCSSFSLLQCSDNRKRRFTCGLFGRMVVGFVTNGVVRCLCLFPGTALWEWVLNSGLVEKLPSASRQVFSSLMSLVAALLIALLDAAMIWLASVWLGVALERFAQLTALLFVFVGLFAVFKVSMGGTDAAFSARLLDAASGGLAHCGLCPFMVGATSDVVSPSWGFSVVVAQGVVRSWPLDLFL